MSRIRFMGASLIALAAGTGAAAAADLYSAPAPAPEAVYSPVSAYNWSGGYIGGMVGYGWGSADGAGANRDADGVVGGVYGGYNFQTGPGFVLGVEGDVSATGMEGKGAGVKVTNPWNATLRARAGVAIDRVLVYGTGGAAFGGVKVKNSGSSDGQTQVGWTLGAGVEAAITNNVIGRIEYRYTDYGKDTYSTTPNTKVDFSSSQVLVGAGFKF